jgi:hypothetical protein
MSGWKRDTETDPNMMWHMTSRGRPPIPESDRRTVILKVRVKPQAAEQFTALAAQRGLSVSDALREALGQWANRSLTDRLSR